jgi:hypothetical protein
MFEPNVLREVIRVASKNKIEAAALLAIVEVESAGRSLEDDGKTPRFLFERHKFYSELKKLAPGKLDRAVKLGLAHKDWRRSTQYKDQGTSKARLSLLARARAVDDECAIRACSWGVGQTMGFLAEGQGFANARAMLDFMLSGGVPAQVECMVREIKRRKLTDELVRHDWAGFARVYNGPGYAQNHYDVKMATAYGKWRKKLLGGLPPDVEPLPHPTPAVPDEDEAIDIPSTRNAEPPKDMSTSKTGWAAIGSAIMSVLSTMADWRVALVLVTAVVILCVFIFWDRRKKLLEHFV